MSKITVFTPTYNRAYILENLYVSLVEQTNKDFVWLIVDDGSTDNTKNLINYFINENRIKIRYYCQENSGKAMAHNLGVEKTDTELFTCVDSDDYLSKDAIDTIITTWDNTNEVIGIIAKRVSHDGNDITIMRNIEINCMTLKEAYDEGVLSGDTFLIYKSSEIKKFQFPKFKGEKFVPEAYLYDQLDQLGNMYLLNKGLYISEYLDDGYTRNFDRVIANNPNGYLAYLLERIKIEKSIKNLFLDITRIVSTFFILGNHQLVEDHYFLSILAYPIGYFLYLKRFKKWVVRNAK